MKIKKLDKISSILNSEDFSTALKSGIYRVVNQQENLNSINVFPVADGDTGTNLALSLTATLEALKDTKTKNLNTILTQFADKLLDSSRGNSGAILAQFFQGMCDSAEGLSDFTTKTFSESVKLGSDYAYDALSEPKEGTILTLISVLAKHLQKTIAKNKKIQFQSLMLEGLNASKKALKETQNQFADRFGIKVGNLYGLSETGPTHIDYPLDDRWEPGSIGIPLNVNKIIIVDENNNEQTPLCIHRAPLSTHERFIGFLIEHYAGDFPLWLAPKQVVILPISEKFLNYAQTISNQLREHNIRVVTDKRDEKIGAKIRDAELKKIPFMLIVGEKEKDSQMVSVRRRHKGDLGSKPINEFINSLLEEIKTRRRH